MSCHEDVPYRNIPPSAVDTQFARDMALLVCQLLHWSIDFLILFMLVGALQAGQEAITLLQNNGSILPLDPTKSVAFIGV